MASCSTPQWSTQYTPQVKLTVTENANSSTATTAVLDYKLEYITHGYVAQTSGARPYSIEIDNVEVKNGTFDINGKSGPVTIASDTKSITRATSAKTVSFSVSFEFNLTWTGKYGGTKTATGSIKIDPKTSYKITYDANGGSGAPSAQTKWHGTAITIPDVEPTRSGYTFSKWNTSSNGSGTSYYPGYSYTGNSNRTLYAIWTANTYQVKYNANGGSGAPSAQTKTHGVDLTLSSTIPTKQNYKFLGWGVSSSATTISYSAGSTYTSDTSITLYAIWELSYVKPSIKNVNVYRCDSSGNSSESGTYYKVEFNWSCDQTIGSNPYKYVRFNLNGGSWENATGITSGSTSGRVSQVAGSGNVSVERAHIVTISVTDTYDGTEEKTAILLPKIFPFDVLVGGRGVAIGTSARLNNYFESAFRGLFSGGVAADASIPHSGRMMVGDPLGNHLAFDETGVMAKANGTTGTNLHFQKHGGRSMFHGPIVPIGGVDTMGLSSNTDLNTCKQSGIYYGSGSSVTNAPVQVTSGTFTLRVDGAGEDRYRQELSVCHKTKSETYIRYYYDGTWGDWYRTEDIQCKSIWSGAYYMNASQTITLSEAISKQRNGIVLAFSRYASSAAQDDNWHYEFIPKTHVRIHPGEDVRVSYYINDSLNKKILYINDNTISGAASNGTSPNNGSVLRYVVGV